jgi:transcription antitermination factor NusA-like protein
VGKQGATIQAISKRTGARINISKQEAAEILEDDDMDTMVDVTIEGDPFAVQMARQDIERIVNEHTSSVNTRLKNIPAEYYPFLAGPHNRQIDALQEGRDLKMQIPHYHTWNQQAPPQTPVDRQPAEFTPQPGLPIQLSGDRQAVAEARAEIERQVKALERQLTLEQMAIERGRHQFIVGELGTSLHDFLHETGCSVILPPANDDSEMLTIVGPPERIEEGMNKIMDLASTMSMASADIARQHANAPRGAQAHARDITRYLQQRQAIEQLERMHNARIVPDSSGAWQIYARDGKNAMKARSDVMNLISGHPPTRFHPIEVDPFFHQHIREQAAQQIRDQHGVRVVVPEEGDESPILLVFEDRAPSPEYELPRRQPSAQDAQAFQQALQQAQQEILALMTGREEIVSRDVEAPVKFHDKIRRHVDRHHQALPEGTIPLQVLYGNVGQPQQRKAPAPNVSLRGPQNDVNALMQNLLAFIEQEKQDELERGFTLSFDFPQKFANHLIGRRGENINRLREEFDVDIQLTDGKCEVKGPEAKANACKKHILEMIKKLEDEATHHLNIPAQYHKDLIGPQGSQVNRLQDRYNVRVNFPRTRQSMDDDASEAGGSTSARHNNQLPHEVIIKGPSKGADACRDELLSLLQYVKDNSFTATVSVAQSQLPSLIGAGGKEMESMRLETGAQIDVPGARDATSPTGRAEIKIKGSRQAVDNAKKLIEEKAKVFDNTVTRNLDVDKRHHRLIIGPQGELILEVRWRTNG